MPWANREMRFDTYYVTVIFKIQTMAMHCGQVWGLIWTKLQEAIFWTICVVNSYFLGNLIFLNIFFYFRPPKHLKLTKNGHFWRSRAPFTSQKHIY